MGKLKKKKIGGVPVCREDEEDPYYYCFKDEGIHIIYHGFFPRGLQGVWSLMKTDTDKAAVVQKIMARA